MKIYVNTRPPHKIEDIYTNTSGLPLYTLETMYYEVMPLKKESIEEYPLSIADPFDSSEDGHIYTDEVVEDIKEDVVVRGIKHGVIEFDLDRELDLSDRCDFMLYRSTYWDGCLGFYKNYDLTESGSKYEYEKFLSTGRCTNKDKEIAQKKTNIELNEKLNFITAEILGSKGAL